MRQKAGQTPIMRLREFVRWVIDMDLCDSEHDFERRCGLSTNYITNNAGNGKGNIGTEMLGRIVKVFPQLNLAWICTGEGYMRNEPSGVNADYKKAYLAALEQIDALNEIIRKLNVEIKIFKE